MIQYVLSFCCIFFLLHSAASAQKEANVWYFGNGAGIDFNETPPLALVNSAMSTPEGCASIADSTGKLLFYTNGTTIWNRLHRAMIGGTNLLGHESATQSAVIVPKPGSKTLYYVFTNTIPASNTGLRYSIVDMSLDFGFGEVITKNIPVMNSLTERLVAIRHQNQRDVWIVVHEWNSSAFYSFLLTPNELLAIPVASTVGSRHDGVANFLNAVGEMKISPNGRRLAVAIFDRGFELFDFSTATGQVSNPVPLFLPAFAGCYGIEFSPDCTKLYGTVRTASQVYQFDLAQPASMIASTAVAIRETGTESPGGALHLAPDGKIYHTRDNDNYLGVISAPNQVGKAANYVEKGLYLAGRPSKMGLPNFMSDYLYSTFSYSGSCQNDTVRFVINDTTNIDSVHWDFGDSKNNYSVSLAPFHIYESPGTYVVTLTQLWKGEVVAVTKREIQIIPLPPTRLERRMALCGDELILNAGSPAYTAYKWSTGEDSPFIHITQPGVYWVEVFNWQCSRIDTVEVVRSTFRLATGSDVIVCEGDSIPLFADGAVTYRWQPATGLDAPTSPTPMASPATTTTYTVTGTGDDGCVQEKSVTVTVMPSPAVDLGPDTTLCIGQSYLLDAGSGATSYRWSTGEESQTISVSATGTYHVLISNGKCERRDSVTVSFVPADITVSADTVICEGDSVRLSATGMASCIWSPQTGIDNPFSATPVVRPATTTTYIITGTSSAGCTSEARVTVYVAPPTYVRLALPSISAPAGTENNIQIPVTIIADSVPVSIPACTISIRMDAASFLPTGCTPGTMSVQTNGRDMLVTIYLPPVTVVHPTQILTELTGTTLVSNNTQTELTFGSVISDGCLYVEQQTGMLSLHGCAIENRTVTFASSAGLAVSPNPVSDDGRVSIGTVEDGEYALAVYTIHGQKIWQDTFVVHATDTMDIQLPTALLATGLYQLVLTTPSALRTLLFFVSH